MAGNKIGGARAAATNKRLYGEGYYAKIGREGGKVRNPDKGFGGNRALARIAGAKGGRVSKRTKNA